MLLDGTLLIGQKLVENAKIEKFKLIFNCSLSGKIQKSNLARFFKQPEFLNKIGCLPQCVAAS